MNECPRCGRSSFSPCCCKEFYAWSPEFDGDTQSPTDFIPSGVTYQVIDADQAAEACLANIQSDHDDFVAEATVKVILADAPRGTAPKVFKVHCALKPVYTVREVRD